MYIDKFIKDKNSLEIRVIVGNKIYIIFQNLERKVGLKYVESDISKNYGDFG